MNYVSGLCIFICYTNLYSCCYFLAYNKSLIYALYKKEYVHTCSIQFESIFLFSFFISWYLISSNKCLDYAAFRRERGGERMLLRNGFCLQFVTLHHTTKYIYIYVFFFNIKKILFIFQF